MTTDTITEVAVVPMVEIHEEGNIRRELRNVEELTESIRRHGLLTAVTLEPHPEGGYILTAGYRRLAAASRLGMTAIPAVIKTPGGTAHRVAQRLAENLEREGLSEIDQADAVQQLLELGADPGEVAATLHTTVDNVEAWRAVAKLPAQVRELIDVGDMSAQDAHQLVPLADDEAAVGTCIRLIGEGWPVRAAVDMALRERKQAAQEEKARARLAKEACRVVDSPRWGTFAGNSKTQRLGQGPGDVRLTKREHAKLLCHAAYLDREGKAVYVCTDRTTHAGQEGSGVPNLKAERAANRAAKKALRVAHAQRFRTIGAAVRSQSISREDAVTHVLGLVVDEADHRTLEAAAQLLGLDVAGDGVFAAEKAVKSHAAQGANQLVDVALAVTLAEGEHGLSTDGYGFSSKAVAAHVSLLRRTGVHEFGTVEMDAVRLRLPYEMRREFGGDDPDLDAERAEATNEDQSADDIPMEESDG